jgi:hypothetical protein
MITLANERPFVYGVDFSGARDAGNRIWIARGVIKGDVLIIRGCFRAQEVPGSGKERERSFKALRAFITAQKHGIFGMDFPFGIPSPLVKQHSWEEFVSSFDGTYRGPNEFRTMCMLASSGRELKRRTDMDTQTPFSPYNLRVYRQTYFGIRDVLRPLIKDATASVVPMQKPLPDKAWIVEICPASTLKREHLRLSYKGKGKQRKAARAVILEAIEKTGFLTVEEPSLRSGILGNPSGDAIDSVIAAFATFRALRNGLGFCNTTPYSIEGRVYV